MWAYETVFYQIYPLGFCGAPFDNPGAPLSAEDRNAGKKYEHAGENHSILKVIDWIDHLKKLNIGAIYFSPLFESDTHGYNTRDYTVIDSRIGTNEDFKKVVDALHDAGIKVVIDAVFNHVGRGFWAFQDVLRYRWDSIYKNWFNINFDGNSNYNDGLWYEGWEGNYDLVKLNLGCEEAVCHVLDCVKGWVDEFDIDGLRLDVAYCLSPEFLKRLRSFTDTLKDDFFLVGECLHGDYNRWMGDDMCHSVTNYECYKGLYSSFNSMNMFEICHSLLRQFGPDNWCLYRGRHLLSFVDNHDVTRVASILSNEAHLPLIYTLAFGMPGIPCVYYGSEWGEKADKSMGDPALRPCFDSPSWNAICEHISKIAAAKRKSAALQYGDYKNTLLTNRQCIIERKCDSERVLVCINADENEYTAHFDAGCGEAYDLITGERVDFGGGLHMNGYSSMLLKMER
ncbi:MAG: cyclomaltodextrinase [Lachnospiraceae bacterium]|nr:cyclomaltodextrinase [Lachnospiraceae bacterium]